MSLREPPVQAQARRHLRAVDRAARLAALDEAGRIAVLAKAILEARRCRGEVTERDLMRAGICEDDARRLYQRALDAARALDPVLMAAAP